MKKILLTTIFAFAISLTVQSQITEGNWMVGGSGSYNHITVDNDNGTVNKNSRLTIKPDVGYFILDKLVVGSSMGYYHYKSIDFDSYNKNYSIGLFSRYYFLKSNKRFNLFTQIHYDRVFFETKSSNLVKGNGNRYGLKVGQVIFFNSSVGLEFSIDYEKEVYEFNTVNNINVNIGFQIHLEK
ncbi:MAG: hypothetical protein COA67_10710 [Lutibacter sp.]|nr:MAG: hypothetical protein COA67_10710 [Lutibacter sp.]